MAHSEYKFFSFPESGNCYKIHLILHYLDIPHKVIFTDITKGESRTPEFLKINPNGRVPVLETEEGDYLSESHAILWYLAEKKGFLPNGVLDRSKALQWMGFEQYNLEPNIAVLRFFLKTMGKTPEELGPLFPEKQAKGFEALGVLEQGLEGKDFLVGNTFSIADIALFGYTHVSGEGACPLDNYPNILRWIQKIKTLPGYISIED